MTEKELYQKAKKTVGEDILTLILLETVPRKRLARISDKAGISYSGVRTSSVSAGALAFALSEEFFKDPQLGIEVIRALNTANAAATGFVRSESARAIDIALDEDLIPENRVFRLLWGLVTDKRTTVNALARPIINGIRRARREVLKSAGKREPLLPLKEGPEPEEEDEGADLPDSINRIFDELHDGLRDARKCLLKELAGKGKLEEKFSKTREELSGLRVSQDELRRVLKTSQVEREALLKETEQLRDSLAAREPAQLEKLSHTVHQLERENRKLHYEVAKTKESEQKLKELDALRVSLEKQCEELKRDNLLLKGKQEERR